MTRKNTKKVLGLTAIVTLALVACGDNAFGPDPAEVTFAASLGIDLANMTQTTSGLYYQDDVVGDGTVAVEDAVVLVTYSGWLVDGTLFDSGQAQFVIGVGQVIAGFEEGATGMAVRGERTIVIPSSLAYGSDRAPGIPSDAVLVFALVLDAVALP